MQPNERESLTVTIEGHALPSWNTLYAGRHWTFRSALRDKWHALVRAATKRPAQPLERRVDVYVANYNARIDPDNICDKLAIDGLKAAGILADDTAKHVRRVTTESLPGKPRVVITITEATGQ